MHMQAFTRHFLDIAFGSVRRRSAVGAQESAVLYKLHLQGLQTR